jgi:cell division protease FtsH
MGMEGYWGMGETVASHAVNRQPGAQPLVERERDVLEGDLGRRIERKLQELLDRTEEVLRENRVQVLAVAHALETHKTVTGDDVQAIIEGREGRLLDGRPYHTPEFARLAEAYHDQAVEAHHEHASVKTPLPVLTAAYDVSAHQGTDGDGANSPNGEASQPSEEPESLPEA